jgi:hypothetical protein
MSINIYDPSQYKRTSKKKYNVYLGMPVAGTKVHNFLEKADYVTEDGKRFVLSGTRGEQWVVPFKKLQEAYVFDSNKQRINEASLRDRMVNIGGAALLDWTKLETIPGAVTNWALFIPLGNIFPVKTAWGAVLTVNAPGVPHGKGDFVVCADAGGQPNLHDMWVVNGEVFPSTYDMRGFAKLGLTELTNVETEKPKTQIVSKQDKNISKSVNSLPPHIKALFEANGVDSYDNPNHANLVISMLKFIKHVNNLYDENKLKWHIEYNQRRCLMEERWSAEEYTFRFDYSVYKGKTAIHNYVSFSKDRKGEKFEVTLWENNDNDPAWETRSDYAGWQEDLKKGHLTVYRGSDDVGKQNINNTVSAPKQTKISPKVQQILDANVHQDVSGKTEYTDKHIEFLNEVCSFFARCNESFKKGQISWKPVISKEYCLSDEGMQGGYALQFNYTVQKDYGKRGLATASNYVKYYPSGEYEIVLWEVATEDDEYGDAVVERKYGDIRNFLHFMKELHLQTYR